jgi:hypothetical protein
MPTTKTITSVPSLTIAGSGGVNTAANTITFNFSKAVKDGLFTSECLLYCLFQS